MTEYNILSVLFLLRRSNTSLSIVLVIFIDIETIMLLEMINIVVIYRI